MQLHLLDNCQDRGPIPIAVTTWDAKKIRGSKKEDSYGDHNLEVAGTLAL